MGKSPGHPFLKFLDSPLCNSLSLAKKIEMKIGRRTLLISLSEVADLFFQSQLLLDDIMLYGTFETNMNFYLDHIFYYVLTSTVSYLQMPVFASSSLVLDYKGAKHTVIIKYAHVLAYLKHSGIYMIFQGFAITSY